VAGGLFGYLIGYLAFTTFGAPLVNLYHLQEEFAAVENYFSNNAFWSILVAAFTPIPYKVFTLAAGLFRVNIWTFVLASLVGRGARFFAVAYLTKRFGERVMQLVLRYVNAVILILVFLFLVYFFFLR
jgi:membrane protein YqaA with SNARE-associated domain